MRIRIALLGLAIPVFVTGQQPEDLPRFRAGTNLVRVDAYVSLQGQALTDLTQDDFQVFEDDKLQKIEDFELVAARPPNDQRERRDPTTVEEMRQQVSDAARVFTLFLDEMRVSLSGSYRVQKPIIDLLDRVIGPDDLVGTMTPKISPSAVTYVRRTASIERMVMDNWTWGMRDTSRASLAQTPSEEALEDCYGVTGAAPFIARLREEATLDALEGLVTHLDGLRPERKFVLIFTEGWPLYRPAPDLLSSLPGGGLEGGVAVDPRTGGMKLPGSTDATSRGIPANEACNRLATRLAYSDNEFKFRELLQRANRSNVSFYPVDARGLVVFDMPTAWDLPPSMDAALLRDRYDDLRMMALQTDGEVVLNTNDVSRALQKIVADLGSYYLLSYYSSNAKLDGRFRRIRVEVNRPDVNVRARPGYLAPTEAEARAAGAALTTMAGKNVPPPTVTRALDAIAPARGNLPVRVQAAGAPGTIRAIVELDPATAKRPEWLSGAVVKVTFEQERVFGQKDPPPGQTVTVALEPGQRSLIVEGPDDPLPAGRYAVRAEITPRDGRLPLQVTTFAVVPQNAVSVGTGALALRRGPSTGLAYIATADPRFRRTERLRVEVPTREGVTGTGRLLTREGQPMPLVVTVSTRVAEGGQHLTVGDLTLAPLAAGEYVLELALTTDGKTEPVSYGFRIVP